MSENQEDNQSQSGLKKDRYIGQVNPDTGLRHGQGVYKYKNPYFQYEGEFVDGVKHGKGKLIFSDGGFIEGNFENNQIMGEGMRQWGDGSQYIGNFKEGEMHGEGSHTLSTGESYHGEFNMNVREGKGELTTEDSKTITGTFKKGHPHGDDIKICFENGDYYRGQMDEGDITGRGEYKSVSKQSTYYGHFVDGQRAGNGKYTTAMGYELDCAWDEDKPETFPTHLKFVPPEPVEEEDPKKAKKGEEEDPNPNKLKYKEGQEAPLSFELHFEYQGPDYENPEPPTEEEEKEYEKERKKQGDDWEPPVRMITPDPVLVEVESGRKLEFEIGHMVEKPVPEGEEPPEEPVMEWVQHKFDQNSEDSLKVISSDKGVLKVEGLTYKLSEEFGEGKYEIKV